MSNDVNEDVAVVREREEARCDACAAAWQFKDEGGKWCAYDYVPRLQARLEAAERTLELSDEDHDLIVAHIEAERDKAQADAERLAEAGDVLANASIRLGTKACMDARAGWKDARDEQGE